MAFHLIYAANLSEQPRPSLAHTYGNASANTFDALTNIEGKFTLDGDSAVFSYKGNLINQLWLLGTPAGVSFSSTAEQTLVSQVYGAMAAGSNAVTMLDIQARHMKIGSVRAAGNGATNSTGVNISEWSVEVGQMHVTGFSGAGSVGVKLAASDCRVAGKITDCATCFDYASGSSNDIGLKIFTSSGQTSVLGGPRANDRVDIVSGGAGSPAGSTRSVKSVDFAINSTGVKTVSVTHGLLFTPQKHDVQVSVAESTNVIDYAVDFVRVSSVSSTQITFDVMVSTASVTGGAVATLVSRVDYA